MLLRYEDRTEMQRSVRKAGIRDVYVTARKTGARVTVVIDTRSMALFESPGSTAEEEMAAWKAEHFEVIRGEVLIGPADGA